MSGWDLAGYPFLGIMLVGFVFVVWKTQREIRRDRAQDRKEAERGTVGGQTSREGT